MQSWIHKSSLNGLFCSSCSSSLCTPAPAVGLPAHLHNWLKHPLALTLYGSYIQMDLQLSSWVLTKLLRVQSSWFANKFHFPCDGRWRARSLPPTSPLLSSLSRVPGTKAVGFLASEQQLAVSCVEPHPKVIKEEVISGFTDNTIQES